MHNDSLTLSKINMASRVPTVRQFSSTGLIFQFIILALLTYVFYKDDLYNAFIITAIVYSVVALLLRNIIAKQHRKGIKLVKQQKFEEAIPYFEKSYDYFIKNNWLDKYRFITLLSASKIGYTESALINIAFCNSQIGNGQKAIAYYKKALDKFPESMMAQTALRMLTSVNNKAEISDKDFSS